MKIINFITNKLLSEGLIKAILRVFYYKYIVRVSWQPGYDINKKTYFVILNKIKLYFKDCPFLILNLHY